MCLSLSSNSSFPYLEVELPDDMTILCYIFQRSTILFPIVKNLDFILSEIGSHEGFDWGSNRILFRFLNHPSSCVEDGLQAGKTGNREIVTMTRS